MPAHNAIPTKGGPELGTDFGRNENLNPYRPGVP